MISKKTATDKPVIAVTIGDPAGIGPEIVLKALASPQVQEAAVCAVIGDRFVLERACGITGVDPAVLHSPSVRLVDIQTPGIERFATGTVQAVCGTAAFNYIQKSAELALSGAVGAVATAPINKESLRAAAVPYIGHTEIFGALTGTADPLTMFEVRGLRIFFLSRHVSLRKACDLVTKERITEYVIRCTAALRQLGIASGTMAVAGLNPHSGEHGLFGLEDTDEIAPAVAALRERGYDVTGPVGADSVFHLALQGAYNSVLSLYHDQGHIAAKTFDFERTISVTCGMPFIRTSVDHGTAFDIAGTNTASPVSMIEAILLAAQYSRALKAAAANERGANHD